MIATREDLLLAADWLEQNEGDPDEREPMLRAAAWLRAHVSRQEREALTRRIARENPEVPRRLARKAAVRLLERSL